MVLVEPRSGLMIGLHTNTANEGEQYEARTGLDHVGLNGATREDLEAGQPGSTSLASNTPASEVGKSRSHSRQWCFATPTTSSSSSSRPGDSSSACVLVERGQCLRPRRHSLDGCDDTVGDARDPGDVKRGGLANMLFGVGA